MIINSKKLHGILKKLQPAINANVVLPILEYVKLEPGKIIASNLNLTIIHEVPECEETFALPFNETFNICTVTDGNLNITSTLISCGKDKFKLGVPQDEKQFPAIPEFEGNKQNVTAEFFYALVNAEKCRLKLTGGEVKENVCIDFKKSAIVATDGHQIYKQDIEITGDQQCITDANFIRAVALFEDAEIYYNKKFISASYNGMQVIRTLSDLRYPDYTVIFPTPLPVVNLTVSKNVLIASLKKMQVYKSSVPVCKFEFLPGLLTVLFNDKDVDQQADSEIECEHEVSFDEIFLNVNVLLNLLSTLSQETVSFAFTSFDRGVYIYEANKSLLIMPVVAQK